MIFVLFARHRILSKESYYHLFPMFIQQPYIRAKTFRFGNPAPFKLQELLFEGFAGVALFQRRAEDQAAVSDEARCSNSAIMPLAERPLQGFAHDRKL